MSEKKDVKEKTFPAVIIMVISLPLIMSLSQIISEYNLSLPVRMLIILLGGGIIAFGIAGIYYLVRKLLKK